MRRANILSVMWDIEQKKTARKRQHIKRAWVAVRELVLAGWHWWTDISERWAGRLQSVPDDLRQQKTTLLQMSTMLHVGVC
mgnify:CR=1 FL=1